MSIEIPWIRVATASAPRPVLFSGNQEGSLGGPTLPVPRMGDRFAVDISTTQLRQDTESRLFIAALIEATTADAMMEVRQFNLPPLAGLNGAVVDGAGQAGSALAVRGVTPGASVLRGQFFNIIHADTRFLFMVAGSVVANGAGKMTVPIWPMHRFLTIDGEPCDFVRPMIEGQLVGFESAGATFQRNRINALKFSIAERA